MYVSERRAGLSSVEEGKSENDIAGSGDAARYVDGWMAGCGERRRRHMYCSYGTDLIWDTYHTTFTKSSYGSVLSSRSAASMYECLPTTYLLYTSRRSSVSLESEWRVLPNAY
jgi:hypothetical protein